MKRLQNQAVQLTQASKLLRTYHQVLAHLVEIHLRLSLHPWCGLPRSFGELLWLFPAQCAFGFLSCRHIYLRAHLL